MTRIINARFSAEAEGSFVVFVIGMRSPIHEDTHSTNAPISDRVGGLLPCPHYRGNP